MKKSEFINILTKEPFYFTVGEEGPVGSGQYLYLYRTCTYIDKYKNNSQLKIRSSIHSNGEMYEEAYSISIEFPRFKNIIFGIFKNIIYHKKNLSQLTPNLLKPLTECPFCIYMRVYRPDISLSVWLEQFKPIFYQYNEYESLTETPQIKNTIKFCEQINKLSRKDALKIKQILGLIDPNEIEDGDIIDLL